jgi:hypothetical protein
LLHGYNPSSAYTLYLPATEALPRKGDARAVRNFVGFHFQCLKQAHCGLEQDAARRHQAAMPPTHRLPKFIVGEQAVVSVAHLPKDSLDSK